MATTMGANGAGRRRADARWVIVPATAGSAVIHAAVMPQHLGEDPLHGVAFAVMAALLALTAIEVAVRPGRRQLMTVAAVHAGILGLWAWTRTVGLPGEPAEAVGVTDAIAVLLGAIGLGGALAALVALGAPRTTGATEPGSASDRPRGRSIVAGAVACVAVVALTIPAVAAADDHGHDDPAAGAATQAATTPIAHSDDHDEVAAMDPALQTGSITAIFSTVGHDDHEGGTGNAQFHDASDEACVPTAAEAEAADDLVATVTFALERYRDPAVAVADGFRPLGFEPNGVHHYLNPSYRDDSGTLDPARPEALLYGRTPDGGLIPVGVMFMMDARSERGPRVGGCLTPWHAHGYPFAPRGEESPEMMHVWTIPVPGGPFAEHIEGEYARLYLGREAIDADRALNERSSDRAGTAPTASTASTATTGRTGPALTIQQTLNAVNVHRDVLCSAAVRPGLERRFTTPGLIDRICDPVMNAPLPGAEAPPLDELAKAFGAGG